MEDNLEGQNNMRGRIYSPEKIVEFAEKYKFLKALVEVYIISQNSVRAKMREGLFERIKDYVASVPHNVRLPLVLTDDLLAKIEDDPNVIMGSIEKKTMNTQA